MEVSDALRAECRRARVEASRTLLDVASRARLQPSTIQRFEARGRGWSPLTDRIVAAYELELGLERLELWRRALRRAGR